MHAPSPVYSLITQSTADSSLYTPLWGHFLQCFCPQSLPNQTITYWRYTNKKKKITPMPLTALMSVDNLMPSTTKLGDTNGWFFFTITHRSAYFIYGMEWTSYWLKVCICPYPIRPPVCLCKNVGWLVWSSEHNIILHCYYTQSAST